LPALVIVGAQWGDEGKGKVTDLLAERADVVVRYQGGDNAGHTVVIGGREYKMFLLPSGVLRPKTMCVLGNGMVINPTILINEMDDLRAQGFPVDNVRISHAAHMVLPYHQAIEQAEEDRLGDKNIGTTLRGIGPAYLDKYARIGIRMGDLLEPESFKEKVRLNVEFKNLVLEKVYGRPGFDASALIDEYLGYGSRLAPLMIDASRYVNEAVARGRFVLFEGAQGSMLEIDQGTYPYVTSSYPTAGGACVGTGIGPTKIDSVIGVVKAFTSRVGNGPFPTELLDSTGDYIRERGHEFGTRTGRPRRMGWLDTVALKTAIRVNAFDWVAVTRLDTLAGLPFVKVGVAYRLDGRTINDAPMSLSELDRCEPVYREFEGWTEQALAKAKTYDALPEAVRKYIDAIEGLMGVGVKILGTGQDRVNAIVKGALPV
jgi:adenylosuccinate synthase